MCFSWYYVIFWKGIAGMRAFSIYVPQKLQKWQKGLADK